MTEEIWKDCIKFPKYQVSSLGNVRNKKNETFNNPKTKLEGLYARWSLSR